MRNRKLMVRLKASEQSLIQSASDRAGTATATWARTELLKAARSTRKTTAPHKSGDERRLLSLFCGPGGLDQGFSEAGFLIDLAFDNDGECVRTYNRNHPRSRAFVRDIRELTVKELDDLSGTEYSPYGVIGGPPCQSFSVSNVHQRTDDPRHELPLAYARLLRELNNRRPISFFLFENVPGLMGARHVSKYMQFKQMFDEAGFRIYEKLLNAKYYGVPQDRPRIFIVGINRQLYPHIDWVPPKEEAKIRTVQDAIGGLPEPIFNDMGLDPDTFPVHPNHWCLVPRSKKFEQGKLEQGQMYGRSFRTLLWSKPSWAVAYGHREVHVHPEGKRRLSIYEAMLLQTFPKTYRFTGNMSAQIRLVSEAVPVRLAWHLANSIRDCLEENNARRIYQRKALSSDESNKVTGYQA